jgi:hypothetical protein
MMNERFSGKINSVQYRNGSPQLPPDMTMPALEPNLKYVPPAASSPAPSQSKKKVIRHKTTTGSKRAKSPMQSSQKLARAPTKPKKELPRSSVSQPRDHLGRFASKAGAVLWGAAKGTVNVVAGGVKTAQKAHKTIKRGQARARRRKNIELRERAVAVAKAEQKLGKRKKKVIRRRRK